MIETLPFELAIVEYCQQVATQTPEMAVSFSQGVGQTPLSDTSSVSGVTAKWGEILDGLKTYNHSIVGVLRSCRPVSLVDGMLTIEAGYKFHAERISDAHVRDAIAKVIKDVMGQDLKIQTVLKKRV